MIKMNTHIFVVSFIFSHGTSVSSSGLQDDSEIVGSIGWEKLFVFFEEKKNYRAPTSKCEL